MKKKFKFTDKQIITFTKKWTNRLLWCGVFWVTCSYILAFIGKTEIAESLSKAVVTIIIGTFVPYLVKSFFETFCEKHNELKEKGLTEDVSVETKEVE